MINKLDKIYNNSKKIYIDDTSKIVIMSDCHRGDGNANDDFLRNQYLYESALFYYYNNDYTYIELGDGDEMWEIKNYKDIVSNYISVFDKLKKFYDNGRLYMIYGNHDLEKKYSYNLENFLDGLNVYESLILDYKGNDIFLVHGHQVDFLNSNLWYIAKFLVRYIWKNLEFIGINDPTSAAKNFSVSKDIDKKLEEWSKVNNKILIAGHTHRPIFPKVGQSLYFNDGSCIHPNALTCIEIENGCISLVKWEYQVMTDGVVSTKRKVIEGKVPIINFYNMNRK